LVVNQLSFKTPRGQLQVLIYHCSDRQELAHPPYPLRC